MKNQSLEKSVAEQILLLMDDDNGAQSELDAKASGRKIGWVLLNLEAKDATAKMILSHYVSDLCSGLLETIGQQNLYKDSPMKESEMDDLGKDIEAFSKSFDSDFPRVKKDYYDFVADWRDPEDLAKGFVEALKHFGIKNNDLAGTGWDRVDIDEVIEHFEEIVNGAGLFMVENPSTEGSDSYGYIISKEPLNVEDLKDIMYDTFGDETEDVMGEYDWDDWAVRH